MMTFLSPKGTQPVTIRLPAEILEKYKKKAEEEGVVVSRLLTDACVSWWEANETWRRRREDKVEEKIRITKEIEDRKRREGQGDEVHLTDPYTYKPYIFIKPD